MGCDLDRSPPGDGPARRVAQATGARTRQMFRWNKSLIGAILPALCPCRSHRAPFAEPAHSLLGKPAVVNHILTSKGSLHVLEARMVAPPAPGAGPRLRRYSAGNGRGPAALRAAQAVRRPRLRSGSRTRLHPDLPERIHR